LLLPAIRITGIVWGEDVAIPQKSFGETREIDEAKACR
jgi:hypothetical protein